MRGVIIGLFRGFGVRGVLRGCQLHESVDQGGIALRGDILIYQGGIS